MNKKLLIAGTRSGVGKTTIALGLMAALKKRGLQVQPFKVGPDYIDPGFHTLICSQNSYNLDSYFLGTAGVQQIFSKLSAQADISIIEGVMGLFDGKGKDSVSSSAEIAKTVKAPVVLIIDARKIAQSAAAEVYGYKHYDPDLKLKAVIINNVSSQHHYQLLRDAIKAKMPELKVLGYLPKNQELKLPERHLGLVPVAESKELENYLEKLIQIIEKYLDLEALLEIAAVEKNPEFKTGTQFKPFVDLFKSDFKKDISKNKIKVAVAFDQAFNFYYQANLDLLQELGVKIIEVSPLNDAKLPEVDAFYLGGGFPESFLAELEANKSFQASLKAKAKAGLPIYAECGGLMYLCNSIEDLNGAKYNLAALIPAQIKMTSKLQEMGYREITALSDNLLLAKGDQARGHVFHYSQITNIAAELKQKYEYRDKLEGYSSSDNILASYVHLHFWSNPKMVQNFLTRALSYQKNRGA
ncbi:MAG: cobyrinate a,c-diamide synthase [Bacillota bacterium]